MTILFYKTVQRTIAYLFILVLLAFPPEIVGHNYPCDPESDSTKKIESMIKRKIAFKMSAVSPSISSIVTQIGRLVSSRMPIIPELTVPLPGLDVFTYIAARWPIAWLYTSIDECTYNEHGVTIRATYRRVPKIPFAGDAIWTVWLLHKAFLEGGAGSLIGKEIKFVKDSLDTLQTSLLEKLQSKYSIPDSVGTVLDFIVAFLDDKLRNLGTKAASKIDSLIEKEGVWMGNPFSVGDN